MAKNIIEFLLLEGNTNEAEPSGWRLLKYNLKLTVRVLGQNQKGEAEWNVRQSRAMGS